MPFPLELAPAATRQAVDAASAARAGRPAARQETVALQTVQRGVDAALGEVERPVAAPPELLDHGVPVTRAGGEHREDQQVESPANLYTFHT